MQFPRISSTHNPDLSARLVHAINSKTKPLGSLGMLETLAHQMGLVQQRVEIELNEPTILVFAADHGVVAEGISAYPQDVTWQMVENYLANGAAINVFARQNNCALKIIDGGVIHDFGPRPGLIDHKIAQGTRNFAREPAMSPELCAQALEVGMQQVEQLRGNIVGFGEMGIGNTTAAAALMHKLTGIAVADCVGAGTGLNQEGILRKQKVIEAAVALHARVEQPLEVLATFGGIEIAMMTGAMLKAAERRMLLLIDGFIASSALLVAARIAPEILDYCVFAHSSNERGHAQMLQALKARPLLHLDLRLGEGSGCALVLPLVQSAVCFMRDMATFESAQVSEQSE
jgi:nicotinate-nucleotide--dimethylbenzimidazole phosphoribosyltransferase